MTDLFKRGRDTDDLVYVHERLTVNVNTLSMMASNEVLARYSISREVAYPALRWEGAYRSLRGSQQTTDSVATGRGRGRR